MDIKIPVVSSAWYEQNKQANIIADGKPVISITVPGEFGGSGEQWTPEDLFLASVNSCIMMTFKAAADRSNLEVKEYQSRIESIIEVTGKGLAFSKISVKPNITVDSPQDKEKILQLMEKAKKRCLISNSIKAEIEITPQVTVKSK